METILFILRMLGYVVVITCLAITAMKILYNAVLPYHYSATLAQRRRAENGMTS
jgi:hypothetical protein